MPSECQIGFATQLLKLRKFFTFLRIFFTLGNDQQKVFSENERNTLPDNAEFTLVMPQEMPKIYMENLTVFFDHYIVWISISYAQNKSGYTVSCTAQGKGFNAVVYC